MTLIRGMRLGVAILIVALVASTVFVWGNQRQAEASTFAQQILCQIDLTGDEMDGEEGMFPMFEEDCESDGGTIVVDFECSDLIDNDGDNYYDFVPVVGSGGYGPDPDCEDLFDDSEGPFTPPPPTDVCPNLDGMQTTVPEGMVIVDENCVDEDGGSDDVCPNIEGVQTSVPEGKVLVDGDCVDQGGNGGNGGDHDTECSDGIDNDENGQTDYPADANCESSEDNDEGSTKSSGGGGGSSKKSSGGEVLGAELCVEYLTAYIRSGANNDAEQVARLQQVLRDFEGMAVEVTGVYDAATLAAVHTFQTKYASDILTPWGIEGSTGYVYYTTRKKINEIYCKYSVEFPLTDVQKAEIDQYKTKKPAGLVGSAQTKPKAPATAEPVGIATPELTAAVANIPAPIAPEPQGNWWSRFWGWVFGR